VRIEQLRLLLAIQSWHGRVEELAAGGAARLGRLAWVELLGLRVLEELRALESRRENEWLAHVVGRRAELRGVRHLLRNEDLVQFVLLDFAAVAVSAVDDRQLH